MALEFKVELDFGNFDWMTGDFRSDFLDLFVLTLEFTLIVIISNTKNADMEKPTNSTVSLVETSSQPLGIQLVDYRSATLHDDPMDLVSIAEQVQKADDCVRAHAGSKLIVIAKQIHYLQEQAKKCLEEAKRDAELHHAACNMVKKPGSTYYLYKRQSGQTYLSILSPQEWGSSCPHTYVAAYRLETDMSWTPLEDILQKNEEMALMDKVINAQLAISDTFSGESPSLKEISQVS